MLFGQIKYFYKFIYMIRFHHILLLSWSLFILSCDSQQRAGKISISSPHAGSTIHAGLPLVIKVDLQGNENAVDSIVYSVDGNWLASEHRPDSVVVSTDDWTFGQKTLSARVFRGDTEETVYSQISFYPPAPQRYGYKVVNEFPHDNEAFTQGLEYHDGYLYESTGQYDGRSTLRKVDLNSGKIINKINLGKEYFGEGLTILDDKIIQLTWREDKGFIYDLSTLRRIGEFSYGSNHEGWGICFDGTHLIMSDGTSRLYFLNKNTFEEEFTRDVRHHRGLFGDLNELEYIDGKIFANVYQQDIIVIIDPSTGAIEGEINLIGLFPEMQNLPYDHELNGIAYDHAQDRLLVTGKNWSKLFEIELVRR